MGVSERVVVLMSVGEKQSLDGKAARSGKSVGELVRRAVDAYDEEAAGDAIELRRLLDVLAVTHRSTLDLLDSTERKLDDTLAYLRTSGRQTG